MNKKRVIHFIPALLIPGLSVGHAAAQFGLEIVRHCHWLTRTCTMKILLALLPFLMLGCSTQINDLQVDSVQLIRFSDAPYSWHWIRDSSGWNLDNIKLLRIHVSSATDVVKLAEPTSFYITHDAYFCHGKEADRKVASNPFVGVVGPAGTVALTGTPGYYRKPDLAQFRASNGRLTYVFFVPLAGPETLSMYVPKGSARSETGVIYDVATHSDDLCIQMQGGTMFAGERFHAAPVVVERANILKAIQR